MLTLEDYNLDMLMEECAEVIQRASKQLRFGAEEIQEGQINTNRYRLREEVLDVLTTIRILVNAGQLGFISSADVDVHYQYKREKINKMMRLSVAQGRLEP